MKSFLFGAALVAIALACVGMAIYVDVTKPRTQITYQETSNSSVRLVTLPDGTRCVLYGMNGGISCNWTCAQK